MMGSIIRWFHRTLPPILAILSAIGVLAIMEGFYLWARWCLNVPEIAEEMSSQFLQMRDGFFAMMMFVYGAFRVFAFHPLFRLKYRAWLEQTPWTAKKPLPLGPIHLIGQDVLLLGVVLLLIHGSMLGRIWALEAFFFAYLGVLGISFWRTGPWWMGYLVFFGLGLAFRMVAMPSICLGILGSVYVIVMIGLPIALQRFPWTDAKLSSKPINSAIIKSFGGNSPPQQKTFSIWPYNQLLNVPAERIISRCDGFLGPLLAAWWLYALTSNFASVKDRSDFLYCLFVIVVGIAFGCRAFIYMAMYWPPISLLGRIFTRRWIIPGYDYVVLAPLCILLTAIIGGIMINYVGQAYNSITYPLTMAAVCIVALNLGPSLGKWRLTGHYRLIYSNNNTTEQNQIKL